MHERSLVRALLRQVEGVAAQQGGGRVVAVRVRIGEFSGVEPDLLASAYDDLVGGSSLCGARLTVQRVPLEARCERCGERFAVEQFEFRCARCGSLHLSLEGGEELLLESVTMEEFEP